MLRSGASAVFPLPLSPLELAFLAADVPRYPMQFQLRLQFRGELEREDWMIACRETLCRHPLLTATIRPRAAGGWEWVVDPDRAPALEWVESPAAADQSPLDLQCEPGLRISITLNSDGFALQLQVHHATCDALGSLQFLAEVRERYLARVQGRAPNLPALEERRLLRRADFGLTRWGWCLRWPQDSLGLLGLWEYRFHQPSALGEARDLPGLNGKEPRLRSSDASLTLTQSQTGQLRDRAPAASVTLNDLLVTALFETLHMTLLSAGRRDADNVLRVTIPTNLRQPEDLATPAANIVSLVFLDRRPGRFRCPQALLRSVHREMWICKLWKAGITLVRILCWQLWFNGGTLPPPREDRCLSTAVLSNLAEPWKSVGWMGTADPEDPLPLQQVQFAPPVSALTAAAIGVVTWNQRLTITLNHDRRRLSDDEAASLLQRFTEHLTAWITLPL